MACAKTYHVEKWGLNNGVCGKSAPCLTIGHALDVAARNDRVIVGPGIYNETLVIQTNQDGASQEGLKLESTAGRYGTIIDGQMGSSSVLTIDGDRVRVGKRGRGFTFTRTTSSNGVVYLYNSARVRLEGNRMSYGAHGILALGAGDRLVFRDNITEHNDFIGIFCAGCSNSQIRQNRSLNNGQEGIFVSGGEKLLISENYIRGNPYGGIRVDVVNTRVIDNVVELNGPTNLFNSEGVYFQATDGALAKGNIVAQGGLGGSQPAPGFRFVQPPGPPTRPVISNNLSMGNRDRGFDFAGPMEARVERNTAVNNGLHGMVFGAGTGTSRLKDNNTMRNQPTGFTCSIVNDTGSSLTVRKQFFSTSNEFLSCNDPVVNSPPAAKPGKTNINKARKL